MKRFSILVPRLEQEIPDLWCLERRQVYALTRARLTLHLFAIACLDSFYTFLREAQLARRHERIVQWPFPIDDFPQRELITQGRDRPDDPVRFRLASF